MKREIEEIAVTQDSGHAIGGEIHTHPSFAQIGASRVSGMASLYGSDFKHQSYITIRIAKSEMRRSLSNDWPHESISPYIEVNLSEAQWAHFVSSMNQGNGTLCTLRSKDGIRIPLLPEPASRKDQFKDEARKTCGEALDEIDKMIAEIDNLTLAKKSKDEMKKQAGRIRLSITSSLPYVLDQFGEHMEVTVEKAKIEINTYATQTVMRAGIGALQSDSVVTPTISFDIKE